MCNCKKVQDADLKAAQIIGTIILSLIVGIFIGILIGNSTTGQIYRFDAIEAGVGQYNPTTGVFEFIVNQNQE